MTGFGRSVFEAFGHSYRLELRSVNSRFLDVKTRLPWADGVVENAAQKYLRSRLSRGRVDLTVLSEGGATTTSLMLNHQMASQLAHVLDELRAKLGCEEQTAALLLPPIKELVGVGGATSHDSDELWQQMEAGLGRALEQLAAMRAREGEALLSELASLREQVGAICDSIEQAVAGDPQRLQQGLAQRLAALTGATLDPIRMAQEVALLADRCDVSEELTRLRSHLGQLKAILEEPGPVGRRVEFMLQELNRELNTVASKTVGADVAQAVVEAKGFLEKMREQAQNVE